MTIRFAKNERKRVCSFSNSLASLRIKQVENDSMLQFAFIAGVRGNFQQPKLHCFSSTLFSRLHVVVSHSLQLPYRHFAPLGNGNKYWTPVKKSSHFLDPTRRRVVSQPGTKKDQRTDLLCRLVSDTIFSCPRTPVSYTHLTLPTRRTV